MKYNGWRKIYIYGPHFKLRPSSGLLGLILAIFPWSIQFPILLFESLLYSFPSNTWHLLLPHFQHWHACCFLGENRTVQKRNSLSLPWVPVTLSSILPPPTLHSVLTSNLSTSLSQEELMFVGCSGHHCPSSSLFLYWWSFSFLFFFWGEVEFSVVSLFTSPSQEIWS